MLIAMLWMVNEAGTTDIPTLMDYDFPPSAQTWLWLAFFASFAVKMPMWPVHTWLPDAHVQAPTAGSVILAGVLLKMGGYGFIRFSLPMFPEASAAVRLADLGPVDGRGGPHQPDRAGPARHEEADRLFLGRAHGDRHRRPVRLQRAGPRRRDDHDAEPRPRFGRAVPVRRRDLRPAAHPRDRRVTAACAINMPHYALFFMLFTMASVGLPGTSGFVGEFLSLAGIYQVNSWVASSAPPASSLARPTCSTSTAAWLSASRRTPMPPPCPTSTVREWLMLARSPQPCCGWASIRKASLPRCAQTSPRSTRALPRRAGRRCAARQSGRARHRQAEHAAQEGGALMDFADFPRADRARNPPLACRPGAAAGRRLGR